MYGVGVGRTETHGVMRIRESLFVVRACLFVDTQIQASMLIARRCFHCWNHTILTRLVLMPRVEICAALRVAALTFQGDLTAMRRMASPATR